MSIRWMAVQFVGDTLRLPIVNKPDMDKPFGSSKLERDVRRIVVNPFSDNPQTFVPESENTKLRELVSDMYKAFMHGNCYRWCEFKEPCNYISDGRCQWYDRMRKLGIETGDGVS